MKTDLRQRATATADRLSGPALFAFAIINTLFAAITLLLAMSLGANAATQAEACGGNNIVDQLADEDPARLDAIRTEAKSVPFGEGILFKIEKDGVQPSWLFGTMHMTDQRVIAMPEKAHEAFATASTIVIESTEILDQQTAQMALLSRPELTMFTDEKRLSDFLSEEDRKTLADGLAKRGMQLALVDRMKPWLVTGMVALPQCELDRKQAGEPFLDMALAQNAVKQGKNLEGLETLVEQLDAMASLPMEFHVRGLVDTVRMGDTVDDVIETMIDLYTKGETGMIWPLLKAVSPDHATVDEGYAAFEEAMVNVRNVTMLERATPILADGNAFIAVGALHLPGDKGLANLLKNNGYTVTRVD